MKSERVKIYIKNCYRNTIKKIEPFRHSAGHSEYRERQVDSFFECAFVVCDDCQFAI